MYPKLDDETSLDQPDIRNPPLQQLMLQVHLSFFNLCLWL
jgi:hypothetical protein